MSDWIGDAALLRIDEIHHRIALFPTTHDGLVHEYSTGVRSITEAGEAAGYRPRQLPFEPKGFGM